MKDNALDMVAKGRWRAGPPSGARNPNAKLTQRVAEAIRRDRDKGMTLRELAAKHGTTESNASLIVRGKTWTG